MPRIRKEQIKSVDGHTVEDESLTLDDLSPFVFYSTTSDPTSSANFAAGYYYHSRWLNTTSSQEFLCIGDGVWKKVTNDDITLEPTGFTDPENVVVAYDLTTRKVTLTGGSSVKAYWRGKDLASIDSNFVSGWESTAHADEEGVWFLQFTGSSFTWVKNTPWLYSDLQIAFVYYYSSYKFCTRECHGMMSWQSHKSFHDTVGTYLKSGGDFTSASYVLNSTTATNRRPLIDQTTVFDEDLKSVIDALTSNSYTWFYKSSTDTDNITTANAEIINLSGNVPYYNQFTGGAWQQTLMTANQYQKILVLAVPTSSDSGSKAYRYLFIQGQTVSTTLSVITGLTTASYNLGGIFTAVPEFVFIGEIIIRYLGAPTNNWSLIQVNKLTGNRVLQVTTPAGNYLSSVATDSTLTGSGVTGDPLSVVQVYALKKTGVIKSSSSVNGTFTSVQNWQGTGPYTSEITHGFSGLTDGTELLVECWVGSQRIDPVSILPKSGSETSIVVITSTVNSDMRVVIAS